MPHTKVTRVEPPTSKSLISPFRILQVALQSFERDLSIASMNIQSRQHPTRTFITTFPFIITSPMVEPSLRVMMRVMRVKGNRLEYSKLEQQSSKVE